VRSNRLQNKVAVVTGSASGIGRGCALMFASHGAQVLGCDIDAASAERSTAAAERSGETPMNLLITGANGFIGRALTSRLLHDAAAMNQDGRGPRRSSRSSI
jgi:NAD(P)-dependent dehydrogenase (short-subunit alcohol dehydrogenase family)